MKDLGGDPAKVNPQVPVDLVIDTPSKWMYLDYFRMPESVTWR